MSNTYDSKIKHVEALIKDLSKNESRYALDISMLQILKLKLIAYSLEHKTEFDV